MNSKVIKRMMRFRVVVHHTKGTSSLGDKKAITTEMLGYLQEDIKLVLNRLGRQETSGAQLYLTGEDILKVDIDDKIDVYAPLDEASEKALIANQESPEGVYKKILQDMPILRREVYYRPNASADVGVLYLP